MTKFTSNVFPPTEIVICSETPMDCPAFHQISQTSPATKCTNLTQLIPSNSSMLANIQQLNDSETVQMEETEIIECWDPVPVAIIVRHEDDKDPHGPQQVTRKVKMVIHKWGNVEPINPERFFLKMLLSRGYSTKMIPAMVSQHKWYAELLLINLRVDTA